MVAGTALLFNHDVWHAGAPHDDTQPKYILKTEVMFVRTTRPASLLMPLPEFEQVIAFTARSHACAHLPRRRRCTSGLTLLRRRAYCLRRCSATLRYAARHLCPLTWAQATRLQALLPSLRRRPAGGADASQEAGFAQMPRDLLVTLLKCLLPALCSLVTLEEC